LPADAVTVLRTELLPHAFLVTPNVPEAAELAQLTITSREDMVQAGNASRSSGRRVLIKGGHLRRVRDCCGLKAGPCFLRLLVCQYADSRNWLLLVSGDYSASCAARQLGGLSACGERIYHACHNPPAPPGPRLRPDQYVRTCIGARPRKWILADLPFSA